MVRQIIKDTFFLRQKSVNADKSDMGTVKDLLDTVKENSERCVGMAANMIGVSKRIMVVLCGKEYIPLINPVITDFSRQTYETSEGCLSLTGERNVSRHYSITVEYLDKKFKKQKKTFTGDTAEIIQHEMDHFEGILI